MPNNKKITTRFAPSPTGFLHIGGLRTALYNYLFANKNGGDFLLRIEDTDRKRYVKGATENLIKTLKQIGLEWKNKKPLIQSKRIKIYQKYANQLIKEKKAYYCFCDEGRLEKMRQEQITQKKAPKYDRNCLRFTEDEIKEKLKQNIPHIIRLKIPENQTIKFNDLIRDEIKFDTSLIDDQVLIKSDGYPTYHLANVVDDHFMKITHVIRGEEWLSSMPKHIVLYNYLHWEIPQFAHLPLLLNSDKSKLSKRQGDVAVEDYLEKGYLPEALINFVVFLGWNPGDNKEIFSIKELIQKFSLEKIQKGGAIFNIEKLDWFNGYYIRQMPIVKLTKTCAPYLIKNGLIKPDFNRGGLKKIVGLEQERMKKLSEVGELTEFFFKEPKYDSELLKWKDMTKKEIKESLEKLEEILSRIKEKDFVAKKLKKILMAEAEKLKDRGYLLWPLRVALTGRDKSPGPFEIAEILGKEKTIKRIKSAQAIL